MAMSEPDIGLALVNIVLLGLLFVVAIAIARLRSLCVLCGVECIGVQIRDNDIR